MGVSVPLPAGLLGGLVARTGSPARVRWGLSLGPGVGCGFARRRVRVRFGWSRSSPRPLRGTLVAPFPTTPSGQFPAPLAGHPGRAVPGDPFGADPSVGGCGSASAGRAVPRAPCGAPWSRRSPRPLRGGSLRRRVRVRFGWSRSSPRPLRGTLVAPFPATPWADPSVGECGSASAGRAVPAPPSGRPGRRCLRLGGVRHDVGMRFLFAGDSMTIGAAGDHTWRYRMWRHLVGSVGGRGGGGGVAGGVVRAGGGGGGQ